jgi:chemotaxis protein methyltransferase CheR
MGELSQDISNEQLAELISAVKYAHGFDFSNYSKPSLKRRISRVLMIKKLTFDKLQQTLINVPAFLQEFVEEITVNVTEMFRDPSFYKALGNEVVPYLSKYPRLNIWSAGCSTGEEAYSLAILMSTFGLTDRSFVYGTDVNTVVLANASKGVYSARNMKIYTDNYQLCGFGGLLTDYFSPLRDGAAINETIKLHTLFSVHNLTADAVFSEFQLISCRNVFIYFETALQEKILDLFYNSLVADGFLCLGSKETIRSDYFKRKFKTVNAKENIYQKTGSR